MYSYTVTAYNRSSTWDTTLRLETMRITVILSTIFIPLSLALSIDVPLYID